MATEPWFSSLFASDLAKRFDVPAHEVTQALHRLNLEGRVSQSMRRGWPYIRKETGDKRPRWFEDEFLVRDRAAVPTDWRANRYAIPRRRRRYRATPVR